jgi:hypothetical protein
LKYPGRSTPSNPFNSSTSLPLDPGAPYLARFWPDVGSRQMFAGRMFIVYAKASGTHCKEKSPGVLMHALESQPDHRNKLPVVSPSGQLANQIHFPLPVRCVVLFEHLMKPDCRLYIHVGPLP